MKQKYFIDTQKGVTAIAILLLMAYYNQWQNTTAWDYLALHDTYGILWVLKSRIFPDRQWEQRTTLAFGLAIWAGLSLYWIAPWLLTAPYHVTQGLRLTSSGQNFLFHLFSESWISRFQTAGRRRHPGLAICTPGR